jgi:membrane protein YqaA with SNARE-associated domain
VTTVDSVLPEGGGELPPPAEEAKQPASGAARWPVWFWPAVMIGTTLAALAMRFYDPAHRALWDFVWFTYLGNSLAPLPYDGAVVYVGTLHPVWLVVLVGTAATVVIEYWNMELLARILQRDGTRGFRQHRFTRWTLSWYERAPFVSQVLTCALPIVPHYPMRILATLAHYPMWKYQLTIIVGRSLRYAWLAALGALFRIPPIYLVVVSVIFLVVGFRGAKKMNRDGAAEAAA